MKNIAIQGIEGSNHYLVAKACFHASSTLVSCNSFDAVAEQVVSGACDLGVMAIENTIAGSIIPNYALLDHLNLQIVGEYYLNIHHHLMCLPGETLDTITEVHSHPMALLQCKAFFKDYPHIQLVEAADTADEAKTIAEKQLRGRAAIAPKEAAQLFGLTVIHNDIQTIQNNATRFVIVQKETSKEFTEFNKASLKFELSHDRGSLAAVLNVMSDCKLNLTKIQSLPKIETPWKYAFFVDITFNEVQEYKKAIAIITLMSEAFKVLGCYTNQR